jgi:phospholipase C
MSVLTSRRVHVPAIALLVLAVSFFSGCGGLGTSPANAGAPIPPANTPQDITAINHVVFMLQENRSFDSYFGQLGAYRARNGYGAATDVDGLPPSAANPRDDGTAIGSFHMQSACAENATPDWLESHGDFNLDVPGSDVFTGDGYVHNAEGMSQFMGMVTQQQNAMGSIQVTPQQTTNYYLFSAVHTTPWGPLYVQPPLAVATVTVTNDTVTKTPSAPVVTTPPGVTFTATPSSVTAGQPVTLQWSVPGATEVMVNTLWDQEGRRAMGYYTDADLPYYYFMASNFATSDRWFASVPGNSPVNRIYEYAATSHGFVHTIGTYDSNTVKNIFQLLQEAGITWKVYYTDDPAQPGVPHTMLTRFQPFASQHLDRLVPKDQYFTDLQNGTLAQVSFIEELPGYDEHPGAELLGDIHSGNNNQAGAQYAAKFINALMSSQYWKDSVFFLSFDEAGGFYDHVPGQPAVQPDGIPPQDLEPKDTNNIIPPADFTRTGFRVPLLVVSPFAKKSYVSHTVADNTAVLKFIETRFNLPSLTNRDKAQPDLTEFFDFKNPPWMTPPTPPEQPVNLPCDVTNLQ